jgi:hypothetical protein
MFRVKDCNLCDTIEGDGPQGRWGRVAQGLKDIVVTAKVDCTSIQSACFEHFKTGEFPTVYLLKGGVIRRMHHKDMSAGDVVPKIIDFASGGIEHGRLSGSYEGTSASNLQTTFLKAGKRGTDGMELPIRDDCMDMFNDCPEKAEAGKCEMYAKVCEISCRQCVPPPKADLR